MIWFDNVVDGKLNPLLIPVYKAHAKIERYQKRMIPRANIPRAGEYQEQ